MHIGTNSFSNNPLIFNSTTPSFLDYNKTTCLSSYGIFSSASVPQQNNSSISYTSKAIYLNVTPSSTAIVNSDIFSDNNWNVNTGFGVNFEVGYLTKFNKLIGIGFGAGYSSYSTELKSNPLNYDVPDTDEDGDNYSKEITTTEITEKTKISYFDIPIFLELSNTNIDKIGFYGRIGVKVSFPMSKTFTSSGLANYEGYYPQYYVTLYDIEELGFTQSEIYQDTEMSLEPVIISAVISAGITFPISSYFIIKLGGNANFGLMEILSQKAGDYDKTMYDGNYNKLLKNPNAKTSIRSYGVEIGLIYNFRLY
jgi:hypothetical protein